MLEKGNEDMAENLKTGFRTTEIFPVNRNLALQKLPIYAEFGTEINENVGNQFKDYLENIWKNDLATVHRVRKFCVPAGKSVSVD